MPGTKIRLASERDLAALVRLENIGFQKDQFTEHQIHYLLTRAHATAFVIECDGTDAGAAYMLWRRSLAHGRLYNIVIDPAFQGRGLGAKLLAECELEAARRGCARVTLEVRADNATAIGFYQKHDYTIIDSMANYYEDGTTGYKMARDLTLRVPEEVRLHIPYYAQTLEFTCGPACLMMVLKRFQPEIELTRTMEITLWKEATLVFMTSGTGGTAPLGLAVAAKRRRLNARVVSSSEKVPFLASVRVAQKREVMRLVHEDLKATAAELGVVSVAYDFAFDDIKSAMFRGMVPIVLISTYRLTGDRVPHWVVVTGFDGENVFIHDPDNESYHTDRLRARNLKISQQEFQRMSRFGKEVFRSAVFVGPAGPRVVYQNASHQTSGEAKEVRAAVPLLGR